MWLAAVHKCAGNRRQHGALQSIQIAFYQSNLTSIVLAEMAKKLLCRNTLRWHTTCAFGGRLLVN